MPVKAKAKKVVKKAAKKPVKKTVKKAVKKTAAKAPKLACSVCGYTGHHRRSLRLRRGARPALLRRADAESLSEFFFVAGGRPPEAGAGRAQGL